jgi:hypothetical protein
MHTRVGNGIWDFRRVTYVTINLKIEMFTPQYDLHVSILTTSHMEKLMVEQLKYKTQLKFRRQSGLNLHPLCSNKVPLPNISTNIGYM